MSNQLKDSLRWYDEGNRMIPFEYYPPQAKYPNDEVLLHWHSGAEITFVKEGSAHYLIDGEHFVSQAGDILFIPPNTLHSVSRIQQQSETFVFHLNFIGLETNDYSAINYLEPLQNGRVQSNYRISQASPNYETMLELVQTLFSNVREQEPYFQLTLKSALLRFLREAFACEFLTFEALPAGKAQENQKIKELLSYIEQNLEKKLQISDLADFVNYSQSHFMAFFRKNFGMSCMDYVQSVRIKKAEEHLKYSDEPITEIALKVGFANPSSFNRLFKSKLGVSPRQYRQQLTVENK